MEMATKAMMRRWTRGCSLGIGGLALLVVVGNRDSAFVVERFPEVIGLHPDGATRIVDGVDHDDLVHSPEAAELAGARIRDLS
jgi:hypothetical protein